MVLPIVAITGLVRRYMPPGHEVQRRISRLESSRIQHADQPPVVDEHVGWDQIGMTHDVGLVLRQLSESSPPRPFPLNRRSLVFQTRSC